VSGLRLAVKAIDGRLAVSVVPEEKASPLALGLAVKAVNGRLTFAAVLGKALNFRENQHPRDRHGRFIEVGGTVAIEGGGQGTVLGLAGGKVEVRRPDGQTVSLDPKQATQIRSAAQNSGRNTPGTPEAPGTAAQEPASGPQSNGGAGPNLVTPGEVTPEAAPTGADPAPDADPAGAIAHLRTTDGAQAAWLQQDDNSPDPIGFLRLRTDDPATTYRFGDSQDWADAVDARGMETTDQVPPGPAAPDPSAGGVPQGTPSTTAPDPWEAPGKAPTVALRTPETASPENVGVFMTDGLPSNDVEDEAARQAAKAQVVADLTERMKNIPDDVMLTDATLGDLRALEDGSQVRLRKPGSEDRQVDVAQWQAIRGRNSSELEAAGVEVVSPEQFRTEARQARVSDGVSLWAQTSNGTNYRALALQDTAATLFGMDGHADWEGYNDNPALRDGVDQAKTDEGDFFEAFLLAQYQATQDRLSERGITSVELSRGYRSYDGTPVWADGAQTADLPLRPMSSFTSDPSIAGRFARATDGSDGFVISATVPADRILSTPRSGMGALSESEFVVLDGPGSWAVRPADETDGPASDFNWDPLGDGSTDDYYDDGEDPFDPATAPAGFLADRGELEAAIAAADDPMRRQALMNRAQGLGLTDAIPASWNGDGSIDDPGAGLGNDLPAMTDQEYGVHTAAIETAVGAANAAGLSTDVGATLDGTGQVWTADRAALHKSIVDDVLASAAAVPAESRALLVGGPIGATRQVQQGKDAQTDRADYLTINTDHLKAALAGRDAVPDVADSEEPIAPLERAPLVHEEATYLANLIAQRAMADHKNVAWDMSMADAGQLDRRLGELDQAGYSVHGQFMDLPIETSERRAAAGHRAAADAFRTGQGLGGIYTPPAVIREQADPEWGTKHRAAFESMRDRFADWTVYDDSVDGRPPQRVYGKNDPDLVQRTQQEKLRWEAPAAPAPTAGGTAVPSAPGVGA
jgi:hypothetical protein